MAWRGTRFHVGRPGWWRALGAGGCGCKLSNGGEARIAWVLTPLGTCGVTKCHVGFDGLPTAPPATPPDYKFVWYRCFRANKCAASDKVWAEGVTRKLARADAEGGALPEVVPAPSRQELQPEANEWLDAGGGGAAVCPGISLSGQELVGKACQQEALQRSVRVASCGKVAFGARADFNITVSLLVLLLLAGTAHDDGRWQNLAATLQPLADALAYFAARGISPATLRAAGVYQARDVPHPTLPGVSLPRVVVYPYTLRGVVVNATFHDIHNYCEWLRLTC